MTGKKGFKPALLNYVLLSFGVIGLTIYLVYRYGAPLYEVIYADFFGVVNKIWYLKSAEKNQTTM